MSTKKIYYTVYKIINNINGKCYIGKHVTTDLDDGYFGSGVVLKKAIDKYRKCNFTKKYLHIFDNKADMDEKEKFLVDENFVKSDRTYNIALGGQGGCIVLTKGHPLYASTCEKIKQAHLKRADITAETARENHKKRIIGRYGKTNSKEARAKVSKALKDRPKTPEAVSRQRKSLLKTLNDPNRVNPWLGRKHREDSKEKISANHACVKGGNNPMYGKKHKKETTDKISRALKNQPKITCEYCGKVANPSNHKRWHGSNCKYK